MLMIMLHSTRKGGTFALLRTIPVGSICVNSMAIKLFRDLQTTPSRYQSLFKFTQTVLFVLINGVGGGCAGLGCENRKEALLIAGWFFAGKEQQPTPPS